MTPSDKLQRWLFYALAQDGPGYFLTDGGKLAVFVSFELEDMLKAESARLAALPENHRNGATATVIVRTEDYFRHQHADYLQELKVAESSGD